MSRLTREYEETFHGAVDELRDTVALDPSHEDYLGRGQAGTLVRYQDSDINYAVKLFHPQIPAEAIDEQVFALMNANRIGSDRIHTIDAYSPEERVIVKREVIGVDAAQLSPEDVRAIPYEDVVVLINLISTVHNRGIGLDPKAANLKYDQELGFGLIDLCCLEGRDGMSPEQLSALNFDTLQKFFDPVAGFEIENRELWPDVTDEQIELREAWHSHLEHLSESIGFELE